MLIILLIVFHTHVIIIIFIYGLQLNIINHIKKNQEKYYIKLVYIYIK